MHLILLENETAKSDTTTLAKQEKERQQEEKHCSFKLHNFLLPQLK